MRIEGQGLGMDIGGRTIFRTISLRVDSGTSLAIVGPSGSGKTTLLNCLGLIQKVSSGSLLIDGRDYRDRRRGDTLAFWRDHAAFVYQDSGVIDEETLRYNVSLRRLVRRGGSFVRVEEALRRVGLGGRANERAAVLSGGEKQRLGVARAIYKRADAIFADEPTASLDERNRQLVRDLLLERAHEGCCVIIATHDQALARSCDRVLDLGSVV